MLSTDDYKERIRLIKAENDPFKKAEMLSKLHREDDIKVKDIAKDLSVSPSYVCNYQRLLRIPFLIRDGYYSEMISTTHLFVIARLASEEDMISVYEETLEKALPTQLTEELVRTRLHGIKGKGEYLSHDHIQEITEAIQSIHDDMHVKIVQTRLRAKVIIETKGNLEETSAVLNAIKKRVTDSLSSTNST